MNGTDLRESALATLEATRAEYLVRGRRALLQTLLALGNATIDDVRNLVPLPANINPKLFGAVPKPLVKASIIAPDGYRPSARPEAHRRPVQIWRLVDREAARKWLRDNPEPAGHKSSMPVDDHGQGLLFSRVQRSAAVEGW